MFSRTIDQNLAELAWSLWTELGVSGNIQNHHDCLIDLEMLIVLTALIADADPRLRDEALDWCCKHHHFVSISRLKAILKTQPATHKPYSIFAATLNSISDAKWPILLTSQSLQLKLSGKSMPPRLESPSLLNLRMRAVFGVGTRADLITFFLTQKNKDFTVSDLTEIGYAKSNLVAALDSFVQSGLFEVFSIRNIRKYRFVKHEQMTKVIGTIPQFSPSWRQFLEILLPIRECLQRTEGKSTSTKIIEMQNTIKQFMHTLIQLNVCPPPFNADVHHSWHTFSEWILKLIRSYVEGDFDVQINVIYVLDAAKRIDIQFRGFFDNVESLKNISNEHSRQSLFENYKNAFKRHLNTYIPLLIENDQKSILQQQEKLLSLGLEGFTKDLQQQILIRIAATLVRYRG